MRLAPEELKPIPGLLSHCALCFQVTSFRSHGRCLRLSPKPAWTKQADCCTTKHGSTDEIKSKINRIVHVVHQTENCKCNLSSSYNNQIFLSVGEPTIFSEHKDVDWQ